MGRECEGPFLPSRGILTQVGLVIESLDNKLVHMGKVRAVTFQQFTTAWRPAHEQIMELLKVSVQIMDAFQDISSWS